MESLEEGFFVCDEDGVVSDVNDSFGKITGYGREGLPYTVPHPWEPDAASEPELRQLFDAAREARRHGTGRFTCPIRHRNGRTVWVATQPISGWEGTKKVFVATLRDVTAEHEATGRETAVPRLAAELASAADVAEVLNAGLARAAQRVRCPARRSGSLVPALARLSVVGMVHPWWTFLFSLSR